MSLAPDTRLVLASLSGEADAEWARRGAPYADLALLGGIAIDGPTREAAREMVADRDRTEFLPDDPLAFVADCFEALADVPIRPGINVRAATASPVAPVARLCAEHDAVLEVNAHCRQAELCAAGAGETLLRDTDRLVGYVETGARAGATVSVKVRAEVDGVDLPSLAARLAEAGVDALHVDAMDSESVVRDVTERVPASVSVVANNGVRGRETVAEYLTHGASAVSVGRPSDDPRTLARVRAALDDPSDERRESEPSTRPNA